MKKLALLAAGYFVLSGCASFIVGQNQTLSVEAIKNGVQVEDAECTLANNKGTWHVKTPGTVTIVKGYNDLNVVCKKEGMLPGVKIGSPQVSGLYPAGSATDSLGLTDLKTGAAFDYPSLITVEMGKPAGDNDLNNYIHGLMQR